MKAFIASLGTQEIRRLAAVTKRRSSSHRSQEAEKSRTLIMNDKQLAEVKRSLAVAHMIHVEGQRQGRVAWLKSSLTMDVACASMYGRRGTG